MNLNAKRWSAGAVLILGGLAWAANASALMSGNAFEGRANILTLKGSPFGRTLAVAMRGPVDVYWHQGEAHHVSGPGNDAHDCANCSTHDAACEEHTPGGTADMREAVNGTKTVDPPRWSLRTFALDQIADWRKAFYTRTNPFGSTKMHEAYIMSETEKRLRLSYEMDPGNFAAYGSYFLFLSEALSAWEKEERRDEVHRRARSAALQLSYQTIQVCRGRQDDPAALLTAAVAAHDHANLLIGTRTAEGLERARRFVAIQDACLREFGALRERLESAGQWERIPSQRLLEMDLQEDLLRKYLQANIDYLNSKASRQTTKSITSPSTS
ncbi:MAG: hypothetical protein HKN82_06700 [Akkermansiaceae bacterium]|nr:hypothetical protein [Akkermansiaceae bacterium]